METKADWHRNPDCPTMTGFKCKSFDNTKGVVLERNPYYWCVMPNGDQLPYLDEIQINVVTDAEAGKLQVQQGSVDYCHGPFNQITLQRRPGHPGQRRARRAPRSSCGTAARAPGRSSSSTTTTSTTTCAS